MILYSFVMDQNAQTTKFGLWIRVPEGNGYNPATFDKRIAPHLSDCFPGMSVLRPSSAELCNVTLPDNTQSTGLVERNSEKSFGIVLEVTNPREDPFEQVGLAMILLKSQYGLEYELAVGGVVSDPESQTIKFMRGFPPQGIEDQSGSPEIS